MKQAWLLSELNRKEEEGSKMLELLELRMKEISLFDPIDYLLV